MAEPTALVFLHGGQHGSWCWDRPIAQLIADGFARDRLLALDVPGCGRKRGAVHDAPTLASVAAELVADIRAAGIGSVMLVGHSMAGALLPLMAAHDPALFRELVYLCACVPRAGDSVMATMGQSLRGLDPGVVGWPVDPATTPPAELMRAMFGPGLDAASFDALLAECVQDHWPLPLTVEPMPALAPSAVPATYVVTLQDPILPLHWQGRFAERAAARRMFCLDAPHEVFLSHPQALAALLGELAG